MAFQTKVYNPDEITIVMGPVLITDGFADGEFLRIESAAPLAQSVVGASGEVAVSRSNDRRATVTIILLQTAAANLGLSVLANLFKLSPNSAGAIVPFLAKDQNGISLYTAQNAWVMQEPAAGFDRTAQSREWQIEAANMVRIDGGNTAV